MVNVLGQVLIRLRRRELRKYSDGNKNENLLKEVRKMKGLLRSAIAVVVMMLLSMPLFALSCQAASTEVSQIEQLKQEIEAIQRQNQKQIEELQKKI